MKKDVIITSLVFAVILCFIAIRVDSLDYPHHELNNIQCDSCHYVYAETPTLLPPWVMHEPQNIDDTAYNTLCWSCHNDIEAPYRRTHSSLQIDNSYGNWSVECRTCHNPHRQDQIWVYDSASALYSGEVGSFTETTMTKTDDAVVWGTDEYAGAIVVPSISGTRKKYGYQILSNTGDTLTVSGPMTTSRITVGGTFAIIYGKLIKNEITLDDIIDPTTPPPKTGDMTVRFFKPAGTNSFADGTGLYDGVCEVCHTHPTHFRNDGSGSQQNHENLDGGKQGAYCIDCHSHLNGFAHGGGGGGGGDGSGCSSAAGCHQDQDSHPTHLNGGLELGATPCLTCHMYDNFPTFADNQDILGTTICINCHSADGLDPAKQYWDNPGSSAGEPGSWLAEEGEESFCGSCHDETPGNSERDGAGDNAPNIVGNGSTYGFYDTGHGRSSGNYLSLSWQSVSSAGNPAANQTCNVCHDLTTDHFNNAANRLRSGYENDEDNTNCRQCHNPGTVATADPQWYTTYSAYENSAHSSEKCSDCHDVHGASGPYRGMTRAEHENLCYQCHTEGGVRNFGVAGYTGTHDGGDNQGGLIDSTANFPNVNVYLYNGWRVYNLTDGSSGTIVSSGYDATHVPATLSGGAENDWDNGDEYHIAYVDDIQQAFGLSEKHNLGTTFTRGSGNYTLECVSCHNVHIVTGKHWDVDDGLSPVTRFIDNTSVWGDEPGEKMNDFAAGGSGTGGFYYKAAQGYELGATGLPFDTGGTYRPPKKGSGYNLEFSGDVLPDYTSLCLDCHSYRMSDANPPVNWGQGIGCTDNSVDPPDQRIECGADHGLGVAGKPYYVSDSGTAGFWGSSGNPDVLFDMNYVTRGRHNGHFMRWPYDSADRGAGINFVMSCTDCHEAHGASGPSMLRPAVNNYTPGTGTWNTFCNACHYYYGGQHADMSCGNASCHEANSIHRIIHTTNSGGTQLMLTASGYEADYQRPDFTPDIISAEGHIGSDTLTITFDDGVWSNMDLSGSLDADDFWIFDSGGDNPKTITGVTHTSGSSIAVLTLSASLIESDLSSDTLAMKPASVWNWYEGGYVNGATGIISARAVSGGPWPVVITGPPSFNIQDALYGGTQLKLNGIVSDSDQIYVTFAEGAYAVSGFDLQAGDFVMNCGGRNITSVTHTAGDSVAVLTLDSLIDQAEIGVCTVAAAGDSIFDAYGNPAGTADVTLALPPEASVKDMIVRWNFNEGAGTVAGSTGALGAQEDMHGLLTRNVQWVTTSTKPGASAGDYAVVMDRVSDRGAIQLNYTVNPNDGFPPSTYNSGGAPVIVQDVQETSEFSFSVWIKPTALGCQEGIDLGLNSKLRRDVLTTQFWIKNWGIAIMRFSDDGDPINGDCTIESATHDVLRFWVAVGNPTDMRCDAWGGSWPEYVHPVSPAGYTQGSTLMPTDQAVCDTSATPILPTNIQAHSFAQTETLASGAPTYGVALQAGVWQHIVGTWDGRYIRIYIDSQLAAETDMGGTGNYVMVADPHLWGGDLLGDGSLNRHVSSFFAAGARPIFSASGSPSAGAVYWNANGYYDLNSFTYVGELDDVKYWKIALPLSTIQY